MKISDIDAFAAVVRCQTLSQAAAELGMTQPAITRRVQNLEEALGVILLDRNTKPPRPTDIGRQVFEQCRAILREVDALRELTAGEQPPAGEFRIGLTQGLGELMLPALIAELAAQWPALATQVTTAWGGMLVERVARRELDAALVFLAREMVLPAQVEGERLLATRLVAVGRKGDWPRRSYRLADCHARGGRVVAVGTTTVRALESQAHFGDACRDTNIFITPGFEFREVDLLLTNFHLPKSTLMMLVSAFAGHAHIMALYQHAIAERYRFFSYGDAMLLALASTQQHSSS